mmetsp:Transcript_10267/g.15435  ORF Transcript_10267/g.15435 Transcript_10267/m.15435 type:complete len:95 (+) Transcript_10267:1401-1685(+)
MDQMPHLAAARPLAAGLLWQPALTGEFSVKSTLAVGVRTGSVTELLNSACAGQDLLTQGNPVAVQGYGQSRPWPCHTTLSTKIFAPAVNAGRYC